MYPFFYYMGRGMCCDRETLHPIVYKIFSWIPKGKEIKYFRYVKVYLLAYDIDKQQALLWEVCSYF